ncbi:hypothetical protein [Kocuria atrinae]|uniref:Uncharacterized protein n=1 Tax=Kocuria atrinae TaxID=592377 RepID=A0ABN2XE52_9MICC
MLVVVTAVVALAVLYFCTWRICRKAENALGHARDPSETDGLRYEKPVIWSFILSLVLLAPMVIPLGQYTGVRGGQLPAEFQFFTNDFTLQALAVVISNKAMLITAAISGVLCLVIPAVSYIAARSVLNYFVPVADRDTAEVGEFYKANSVNAMLALSLAVSGAALVVTSSMLVGSASELSELFGAGLFVAVTFTLGFVIVAVYAVRLSESSRLAYLRSIRTESVPQS